MVKITAFMVLLGAVIVSAQKKFLGEHRIPYDFINIEEDENAALKVETLNNSKRKVPTIVFDDTFLVEPSNAKLAAKLALISKPKHNFHDVITIVGGPTGDCRSGSIQQAAYAAGEGAAVALIVQNYLQKH